MTEPTPPEPATGPAGEPGGIAPDQPPAEDPTPTTGRRISEDWAATIVGLALVVLVLAGVIGKGLVP